jgi:hypothetical protein
MRGQPFSLLIEMEVAAIKSSNLHRRRRMTRKQSDQIGAGLHNEPPDTQHAAVPEASRSIRHGRIIDGTQGLGGPFSAWWNIGPSRPPGAQKIVPAQPSGYWDITFEFC